MNILLYFIVGFCSFMMSNFVFDYLTALGLSTLKKLLIMFMFLGFMLGVQFLLMWWLCF